MTTHKTGPFAAPAQTLGWDNPSWEAASVRFLFVRLSPWQDIQRSSPHLFLYSLMRKTLGPAAFGDFAFLPSRFERKELEDEGSVWLKGIASGKGAVEFDALLVSCAYALELVNLPLILSKSGIPLRASRRDQGWPLIIVGGSNSLANQGLVFPDGDSFAEGLYFGEAEAEPGGAELFSILAAMGGSGKRTTLASLEKALPAFWAFGHSLRPSETGEETAPHGGSGLSLPYRTVHPARSGSQENPFLPESYPLLNSVEASTGRLQISWGCPSFCTFCFEGWERKPYREVPREQILGMARGLIRNTGVSTLELYSFNFNAHSEILSLLLELNRIFDRVNVMSQRADILVHTPGMLECELAAEKRSFTIGVEGISEGMRALYAKGLSGADLWTLIERLFKEKAREIKFFYILSGFETGEDLREFSQFCQRLWQLADQYRPSPRLLFSAGYLVRMPFTPLRYAKLAFDRQALETISTQVRSTVEASGFEFRLAMDWDEYVADQLLVLGGHGLAEGLETAALKGVLYDDGIRGNLTSPLSEALARTGELETVSGTIRGPLTEKKAPDYSFPLPFVQPSISDSFLFTSYQAAMERREPAICFGGVDGNARCMTCGACRDTTERTFLTGHRIAGDPAQAWAKQLVDLIKKKRRMKPRYVQVWLGQEFAGAYPEYLSALLLRMVLTKQPELTGRLFRISEALWTLPDWKDRLGWGFYGETVLALYGLDPDSPVDETPTLGEQDFYLAVQALSGLQARPLGIDVTRFYPKQVEIRLPHTERKESLARCRKWLTSLKLAYTERKGSTLDERLFDIAPKDQKKRILSSVQAAFMEETGFPILNIAGGPKLDIRGLLPTEADRFSVSVCIRTL